MICPNCWHVTPVPEEPTDEGGAEFMCCATLLDNTVGCGAKLYLHCDWPGAGKFAGKIEVLEAPRIAHSKMDLRERWV